MHLGYDEAQLKPLQTQANKLKPTGSQRTGERKRVQLG
jgi:hypothetical protein